MKKILFGRTVRIWLIRLVIAFTLSQITGLGIGYCLAAYFVALFLFDFTVRLLLSLTGIVLMAVLALTLFIGLLTI